MTTRLRHIGAAIMGILDPVPSTVPSPMTEEEGAWVRAHAWTKGLRKIDDAYPHGFHRWCSCERGICPGCASGHHDRCVSADGPRVDEHADTITDAQGFVVAVIRYGPDQRPCRWACPCTHATHPEETADTGGPEEPTAPRQAAAAPGPASRALRRQPEGPPRRGETVMSPVQETLFEDLPEMPTASPWCQRWREGRHSWAHVRDGGSDARRYTVDVIPDEEPAKGFGLAHHYLGSSGLICICQVSPLVTGVKLAQVRKARSSA